MEARTRAAAIHVAMAAGVNAALAAIAGAMGVFGEASGPGWVLATLAPNLASSLLVAAFRLRGWRVGAERTVRVDALTSCAGILPLLLRETTFAGGIDVGNLSLVLFLLGKAVLLVRFALSNADAPSASSVRTFVLAATLVLYAGAVFPFARRAHTSGDEPHYLLATHSLVFDGDLDLSNNYRRQQYRSFFRGEIVVRDVLVGRRGGDVPIHDVGLSALLVPGYAVGGWRGALFELTIIGALLALGISELARLLGATPTGAVRGWGFFALCSPLLVYATQVYPEPVGALLLVWGSVAFGHAQRTGSGRHLLAAGTLLGLLPWFSVRYWVLAAALGLPIVLWVTSSGGGRGVVARRLALLLAPGVLSVALLCLLDLFVYGVPVPNAGYVLYVTERRPPLFAPQLADISVLGLLFDRAFGLLPTAPVYLVAIAGIAAAWRFSRRLATAILATVGVFVLFAAVNQFWYGGYAPPPRYVFPVVALLAAFAPRMLERSDGGVIGFLAGWSFVVAVLYTAFPETRLSFPDGKSALGVFFDRHFGADPTAVFPTFLRAGLVDYLSAAVWATAAAVIVLRIRKRGALPDGAAAREAAFGGRRGGSPTAPRRDGSTEELPSR